MLRRIARTERPGERHSSFLRSLTDEERGWIEQALPYSITSAERLVANMDAVRHVCRSDIDGALVECGVWRGGSVLAMIRALQQAGVTDRDIYLFDTFEGMTEPADVDTSLFDEPALTTWQRAKTTGRLAWDHFFRRDLFNLDAVKELMYGTGYPPARIHFVVGKVEDTIPDQAPERIAVLRLDTDWYASTKHELTHLYPRLVPGGVLIIDDYGHWEGCRKAVDEYFEQEGGAPLLTRVDYTGRMAVKDDG